MNAILLFVGVSLVCVPLVRVFAETTENLVAQSTSQQDQRRALEAQLEEYEKQIAETEKTISQYQKQGSSLKGEISVLNSKISKLNLQIKAANVTLDKLNQDINETQREINKTENKIDYHKEALSNALRTLYEADNQSLLNILLANAQLSDFFNKVNDISIVQASVRDALFEITNLRQDLLEQKEELALEKQDTENIKAIQQSQKSSVASTQSQKQNLLTQTKGKESEYQKILKEQKATAAQIRSRLFELLGGGELTFEKAYNLAVMAENASGVRAALILAILNRESLLGKNVGQCTYEKAMHPTRDIPTFLDLCKRLSIDPTSVKVSCANQHGAYGGAMGPAQFIPSTWKLYESKISAASGHTPPNPWNNSDAFVATGVYIKDLMDTASCKSYAESNKAVLSYQKLLERCAAAKYYAGSNWYTYRMWYGEPVVTKADEYEKDIAAMKQ